MQIMLVIGGQAPKAIRSVELYDFKSEKWSHAADMPSRRCRSGLTSLFCVVIMTVKLLVCDTSLLFVCEAQRAGISCSAYHTPRNVAYLLIFVFEF